jgi:lipid-A-disaccharide synthase
MFITVATKTVIRHPFGADIAILMTPKSFMLIAGEASGDWLAGELVAALKQAPGGAAARFLGAGGPRMRAAGVEVAVDMMSHAVIGLDMLKKYFEGKRLFQQLLALAIERRPDAVIGVDYGFFNLRFGRAVKAWVRRHPAAGWNPKIIQFVSPQVWASRPGRAKQLEADYDLLLSIFPFEKAWYSQRAPRLRVAFVGHPMLDREPPPADHARPAKAAPRVVLLPGSRQGELQRHLPVMLAAWRRIEAKLPDARARLVLPTQELAQLAGAMTLPATVALQIGGLPAALAEADAAISKTGTVTLECAYFGVPTVTLYKTSWLTYELGRRIVTVKTLTMPNLLAGEEIMPEFIQHNAIGWNLAHATLKLLRDVKGRAQIQKRLAQVVSTLGQPGAARRAAEAILQLDP